MPTLYALLSGPLLTASLLIFVFGMLARTIAYCCQLDWRRDLLAYRPLSFASVRAAIGSVWLWLLCDTRGARRHRALSLMCAVFHVGLILLILLSPGHAALRYASVGLRLEMPPLLADAVIALVLSAFAFLVLRRLLSPMLRFLSTWKDWLLLALCGLTLVTGLLARLHSGGRFMENLPDVSPWLLLHMAGGELLLILAPFLFSHMLFFFLSRLHLGFDFAVKRGGRKRGAGFPW